MHAIKATFRNGQLELSEPVDWPDGMQVRVVPLTNGADDIDGSPAMIHQWPVGFLNQIRDL